MKNLFSNKNAPIFPLFFWDILATKKKANTENKKTALKEHIEGKNNQRKGVWFKKKSNITLC